MRGYGVQRRQGQAGRTPAHCRSPGRSTCRGTPQDRRTVIDECGCECAYVSVCECGYSVCVSVGVSM